VLATGRIALVHCIEGGFHLGGTPEEVEIAVGELSRRGVAYITLAHLIWRSVATSANAIPFLPAPVYRALFPQPRVGLTELGRAAVTAMVRHGILVEVTHMSRRALDDTFALLDELDRDRTLPVIASHGAYRFGGDRYNLDAATVGRIAARGG
jgi:microsomal dipeptidase-like Zn-dependent dipeptidase